MHDLRHTHASELIADGWDIVEVASRLGDTIEAVYKVYAHEFDRAKRSDGRRSKLNGLFGNATENREASSGAPGGLVNLADHR